MLAMLRLSNVLPYLGRGKEDTDTANLQSRRTEKRHLFPWRSIAGEGNI